MEGHFRAEAESAGAFCFGGGQVVAEVVAD